MPLTTAAFDRPGLAPAARRVGAFSGIARVAAAAGAGALMALALPPLDLWPCLFAAVPIIVWLIDGTRGWRGAFAAGWLAGLGYFTVALHWIGAAFFVDAATYLWMMPFAVGGLAGGMAIYWGIAAALARVFWPEGAARIVWLATTLAAAEWLRGHLLTGFPWAAPGSIVDGMGAVAQSASLVGMTGLTFLLVLAGGLPVLFDGRTGRVGAFAGMTAAIAACAGLWIWGTVRLARPPPADVAGVRLRIVQPNIPQNDKWREDNVRAIFVKLLAMTAAGEAPTHVLWPESAVPFYLADSETGREMLAETMPAGQILLTGALTRERDGEERVRNSILAFDAEARVVARYDKWRLVPGGEFLPFETLLEPLGFRKVVTVPGSFAAGPGPRTLAIPGAPDAAFSICYEAIFPNGLVDPARRPGWIVNVTNDGWFGDTTGPYQHLAQARLRAIEQGLPMVRAANTGVSAVIDAAGRIRAMAALNTESAIDTTLPGALAPTPYARFGDVALAILLAAGLLVALARNLKR